MKHHADRIRHLQQLEADLDRQIADAQQLQRRHRPVTGSRGEPEQLATEKAAEAPVSRSGHARKRR